MKANYLALYLCIVADFSINKAPSKMKAAAVNGNLKPERVKVDGRAKA